MPRLIGFLDASRQRVPLYTVRTEVVKEYHKKKGTAYTVSQLDWLPDESQWLSEELSAISAFEWTIVVSQNGAPIDQLIEEHADDKDDLVRRCLVRVRDELGVRHVLSYCV